MDDCTIRPGRPGDLPAVWQLVQAAVADMNRQGNPQWNADYPALEDYAEALSQGELYVAQLPEGTPLQSLGGVAVFNCEECPEYRPLPWSVPGPALVLHKMAVHPGVQRMGVASALFRRAEALARARGISSLRVDTYAQNLRMQALICKMGFSPVGQVHFGHRPLPFPCFEKVLPKIQP